MTWINTHLSSVWMEAVQNPRFRLHRLHPVPRCRLARNAWDCLARLVALAKILPATRRYLKESIYARAIPSGETATES